ncbi:MAG TPA: hypothetical protein VFB30_02915 [Spirochaetia bacterium]|nr:hypothetical protein [Spirochaetia bacterium]
MTRLRSPDEFVTRRSHLLGAFEEIASALNETRATAERLVRLLPSEVRCAGAFLCRLTNLWRYEFGPPFHDLPTEMTVCGTIQFPPAENLFRGVLAAERFLTATQLLAYLERLRDPHKHLATLAEMAPAARVTSFMRGTYEAVGYGMGNRTIDWLFEPPNGTPILLDVKHRQQDLLEHLRQTIPAIEAGAHVAPSPVLDAAALFRSTAEKFVRRPSDEMLQGVWIHSHIQQFEEDLLRVFSALDEALHFAILAGWDGRSYILARKSVSTEYLRRAFSLVPSENFIRKDIAKRGVGGSSQGASQSAGCPPSVGTSWFLFRRPGTS